MTWTFRHIKRLGWLVFCFLLLAGTATILVWNPRGLSQWQGLHREYQLLMRKNQALEQENRLVFQEITRLRNDSKAIEHLAREELGLVRDDELIIYFAPPEEHKEDNAQ
jgi:cell division protein FtsB